MFVDLSAAEIQPAIIDGEVREITLSAGLREKIRAAFEEEGVSAKIYASTSVVKPDSNYVFFSNHWYYLADLCRDYAKALYPYCRFFDDRIRNNSDMVADLAKGNFNNPEFVSLFINDTDRDYMIRFITADASFRPGKALINNREGNRVAVRSCRDIFGSCVLKKIAVPDASSGYLGDVIYYLAKREELFDDMHNELSAFLAGSDVGDSTAQYFDEETEKENEQLFREWFSQQIIPEGDSNAGNKYSEITIQTYANDIKFHKVTIEGQERTLFATRDLQIIDSMLSNPDVGDGRKSAIRKYRQFVIELNGGDIENRPFSPEWFRSKAGEFPMFDERAEEYRVGFLEKYAPEKLVNLEGLGLLRSIFLNDDNKDNLCYELEYGKECKYFYGGIGGGTAAKYGLYYNNKLHSWVRGRKEVLSEDEAIEVGTQIRDALLEGAKLVQAFDSEGGRQAYLDLYKALFEATDGNINRVWFLKYYQILRPDAFPPIYGSGAQKDVLNTLGIEPYDNSLERMSQICGFAKECGVTNALFSHIYYTYYNEVVTDEEEVIEDVDTSDNESKFRAWMAEQVTVNGTAPSPSMISNNCSALKKVCHLMDIIEYPDVQSIFEITDIDTFVDIKDIIKGHHDYDEVNKACNNRFLSTALNWYEKYLNETQTAEEEEEEVVTPDPYSKGAFLEKVFLTSDEYDKLYKLLLYKKNVILQGAPGVGKTFLAKRFAYSIIGAKDDRYIELIQFHQNYSYEDFIMGYKPTDDSFELKTGVFYNFCKKAAKDKDHKYFFIIDEINRGNLSKIFGELMMLIEGDKRGPKNSLTLAYRDESFYVPENVYMIGMMNTADRSLAMMDYALRRRFSFFDVEPAFGKQSFKDYLKGYISDPSVADKVISRFTELNKKIADEENSGLGKGFCIGHSYFCNPPVEGQTDQEWYDTIIEFEVAPLLDEYWWDDKNKAEDCKKELMKD